MTVPAQLDYHERAKAAGVPFLDLRHQDCRFPIADGLFCGEGRADASSYCQLHHAIAYVAPGKRAFTSGAFLAPECEAVRSPGEGTGLNSAPSSAFAQSGALLDQFVRRAAARRHDAPKFIAPTAPALGPTKRIVRVFDYRPPVSSDEEHAAREQGYLAGLARQCDEGMAALYAPLIRGLDYGLSLRDRVAGLLDMSADEMLCNRRTRDLVRARQLAMFCVTAGALRLSLPTIGRRVFGGFDHTTVLHARDKIAGMIADGSLPRRLSAVLAHVAATDHEIAGAVRRAATLPQGGQGA